MRTPGVITVALSAALVLAAVIYMLPSSMIVDEQVHFVQAQYFARGNWQIHPELSTWPTVNVIVAAPLWLFGVESLTVARVTIAAFAVIAAVGFFRLAAHFDQQSSAIKTAQFFLLPIVLPYCGLVYTDIPALAAIIWMAWAAVRQRFIVFTVAAVLAIAFRQGNIVWVVMGLALYAYEMPRTATSSRADRLSMLVVFGIVTIASWTLIVWHLGGIALTTSTQEAHPIGLHGLPNIEFAIGLGGLLFAPILWSTRARVLESLRRPRWALVLATIIVLISITFVVDHPYNTMPEVIEGFLRNRILFALTHTWLGWVFAVFAGFAAFTFAHTSFCRDAKPLKLPLYLIGLAALLPFGLIEQRYYLPLYTMFWAMRAPVGRNLEYIQLMLNVSLSLAVLVTIIETGIFL
jgi:DIE2/ALG10 family